MGFPSHIGSVYYKNLRFLLALLYHNFITVVDIESFLGRLAAQSATVEGEPVVWLFGGWVV